MWNKLIQFFKDWHYFRVMNKGAKFFDRNPAVQGRFEEIEDWLEYLEERVDELENRED